MKYIFLACISLLIVSACYKDKNPVLFRDATITVLHSTCVKTIVKVDIANANIGETWKDTTKPSPVVYQQVFEAGMMKNTPVGGLTLSKQYRVKIYGNATGPDVICYLLDNVNSPNVRYDIAFLP